jgi:hypothetical protein
MATQIFPLVQRGYMEPSLISPAGFPGTNEDIRARSRVYLNANRVAEVRKVVIDTATNSYTYEIFVNGILVSYTADGSATKPEIAAGLADKINGNDFPENNRVEAVSDGIDTVTITALQAGEAFELYTLQTSKMTASVVTSASTGAELDFGLLVCRSTDGSGVAVPAPVAAVAKVVHATPALEAEKEYNLGVVFNGTIYLASYTSANPGTVKAIVEALVADLNAQLPASSVVATEDDTKVILTAEVAGADFDVLVGNEGTTGIWTLAVSVANVAAGFTQQFAGVVQYVPNRPFGNIQPDETLDVLTESGKVWLTPENAPSLITDTVYCRHTVSSLLASWKPGRIRFDSDSGKAVALDSSTIELLSTTPDSSGRYPFSIDKIRAA